MNVFNGLERYPKDASPSVATIGNYDGVHLGHRAIIEGMRAEARAERLDSLLITFDPHPTRVVAPARAPKLLSTRRQKLEAIEAAGVDSVLVLTFHPALASLSGRHFLEDLLGSRVPLRAIHVGENFRFGHDREGDVDLLRTVGGERGFRVVGVPPVVIDGEVVSSSAIRRRVDGGDVEGARRLLGRPYAVTGEVVQGAGRGRTLRFPTANLATENELLPKRGVYVTQTQALALRFPSITNVGIRPTFGGEQLTVETHLLDAEENLYGERIEVRFLARIRDERAFSSASELADQIARDCAAAAAYFQNSQPAPR